MWNGSLLELVLLKKPPFIVHDATEGVMWVSGPDVARDWVDVRDLCSHGRSYRCPSMVYDAA